jgi:hypothetical protein
MGREVLDLYWLEAISFHDLKEMIFNSFCNVVDVKAIDLFLTYFRS